jgi:DNA (cytosine-5)-methyltransferase 1
VTSGLVGNQPTVGSLFSGIGGLELGLERAGFRTIWQSEIDPYASRVLARHWPTVPNLGDVTKIDWSNVERPDLICGGFPCQPISKVGRQRGQQDDRWLWPHFARAVRELRPRWVLIENVPQLLNLASGGTAQAIFGDLSRLGFDAEWALLPASSVGAPHVRYRAFVVAYPQGSGAWLESGEASGEGWWSTKAGGTGLRPQDGDSQDMGLGAGGARIFTDAPTCIWPPEPAVGRVVDGFPYRLDQLRCLGNAVVPQLGEWIGRRIVAWAAHLSETRLNDGRVA